MKLPIETLQQVHQMLNAIPFLKMLKQGEIEEMALSLNLRHYMKDETIIRQGEPGKLFYLNFKGRVGVYRSKLFGKKQVATIGAGEFFGEIALIENVPRTATVIGLEDGEMFTLARESFEKVLLANPGIATVIRQISETRRAANQEA